MGIWKKQNSLPTESSQIHAQGAYPEARLWRLIYASAAQEDLRNDGLDMILSSARRRNETLEVTGMLMLVDGTFLQVLEGSFENVHGLFDRIKLDRRHKRVRLLQSQPIALRSFPDWTMSPPSRTLREFADARDIEQFFSGIRPPFLLEDAHLWRVLELFHDGSFAQTERWSSVRGRDHA